MFTHPLRYAGASLCALFLVSTCFADERLDDVVISASRLTPVADLLPAGTIILGQQELADIPANNLADVLDTVAGVNGSRFYGINGAESGVDLLGFGATGTQNTLILLNGRRLNDVDLSAVDFSSIPLNVIERIEILPASGAVLYGNGAVGGAINIVTRQRHKNGAGVELLAGDYGTAGGRLYGGRSDEQRSMFAAVQGFDSHGYRDHNRSQQQTAFADWRVDTAEVDAALTVLADNQRLQLPGARRVDPLNGINEPKDNPTGASTPNDWADQQGLQILPGVVFELSDTVRLHLDGGWRIKLQQYFIDGGFGYTSYTEAETVHFSVNPRLAGNLQTGAVAHQWTLGLDFYDSQFQRDVSLDQNSFNQPIHQIDIVQRNTGLYLMDSMALTDSTLLSAGFRHEWMYTTAKDRYDPTAPTVPCCGDAEAQPFDISQTAQMWNLGLRQYINDRFSLFANLEKSARFASVDEFFELDPVLFVTSLDPLEVQTGRLASAGIGWHESGQRAVLTFWEGDFRNEIHYDANAFENINLDPTRRYGVSLNSRWQVRESLWLTVNGSYQRARFSQGAYKDNEVPLVPRQSGYARLDWQAMSWLSLSVAQRYIGRQYFDNDQSNTFGQRIPSYRRSDLQLKMASPKGYWMRAGVYNLEDKIVFDYGVSSSFSPGVYNAYPLPDRHMMVSVGVDW
ncbi:MAG: TonB-dependent receptor [Alcanivoracaceae bacterium]|nr:TonB-dependent receptor [Alcanivoracaceae bacterium]